MHVLFATSRVLPRPDLDTPLLIAALARRGVTAASACWDDPDAAWASADLVVVRSTWDYTARLTEFLEWCERVSGSTCLSNPVGLIRWNSDKIYLAELAGKGIAIPETRFVDAGAPLTLTSADAGVDGQVVVKPRVSGGARGATAGRLTDEQFADRARAALGGAAALVQPFLPEIAVGERSLLFAGRGFTHAVRKIPAAGEWRVQGHFGGTNFPHEASKAEIRLAEAALAAAPLTEPPLLARVDVVGPADAPLLMELELIEPELFLPGANEAVEAFADAIAA